MTMIKKMTMIMPAMKERTTTAMKKGCWGKCVDLKGGDNINITLRTAAQFVRYNKCYQKDQNKGM